MRALGCVILELLRLQRLTGLSGMMVPRCLNAASSSCSKLGRGARCWARWRAACYAWISTIELGRVTLKHRLVEAAAAGAQKLQDLMVAAAVAAAAAADSKNEEEVAAATVHVLI